MIAVISNDNETLNDDILLRIDTSTRVERRVDHYVQYWREHFQLPPYSPRFDSSALKGGTFHPVLDQYRHFIDGVFAAKDSVSFQTLLAEHDGWTYHHVASDHRVDNGVYRFVIAETFDTINDAATNFVPTRGGSSFRVEVFGRHLAVCDVVDGLDGRYMVGCPIVPPADNGTVRVRVELHYTEFTMFRDDVTHLLVRNLTFRELEEATKPHQNDIRPLVLLLGEGELRFPPAVWPTGARPCTAEDVSTRRGRWVCTGARSECEQRLGPWRQDDVEGEKREPSVWRWDLPGCELERSMTTILDRLRGRYDRLFFVGDSHVRYVFESLVTALNGYAPYERKHDSVYFQDPSSPLGVTFVSRFLAPMQWMTPHSVLPYNTSNSRWAMVVLVGAWHFYDAGIASTLEVLLPTLLQWLTYLKRDTSWRDGTIVLVPTVVYPPSTQHAEYRGYRNAPAAQASAELLRAAFEAGLRDHVTVPRDQPVDMPRLWTARGPEGAAMTKALLTGGYGRVADIFVDSVDITLPRWKHAVCENHYLCVLDKPDNRTVGGVGRALANMIFNALISPKS